MLVASSSMEQPQPSWTSYFWEQTTDVTQRLQASPLFWGILAAWMAVGIINTLLLLGNLLLENGNATIVYRAATPSWESRQQMTRSMSRAQQYKNAKTPAVRRRHEMIFEPLP